jgi:hypothetical protein
MSTEKKERFVLRVLLAWNVDGEQKWLGEQARSGWHVRSVHPFGYTFEQGAPAEVAYRLDVGPRRGDRTEYLGLFGDAGWEAVGRRGMFDLFRKPEGRGETPEIHTDPHSLIAMYERVIVLTVVMTIAMALLIPGSLQRFDGSVARWIMLGLQTLLAATFAFGAVRTLVVINRIKRQGHK